MKMTGEIPTGFRNPREIIGFWKASSDSCLFLIRGDWGRTSFKWQTTQRAPSPLLFTKAHLPNKMQRSKGYALAKSSRSLPK